jgi:serine/threonine protein kinase
LPTGAKLVDLGLKRGTLVAERYQVDSSLGHESVSRLYEAVQVSLGRRVLLKVLDGEGLPQEDIEGEIEEMKREVRAASAVEHPNVLEVLDFRKLARDGKAMLVRPRASRDRLAVRLRLQGKLALDDVGDIFQQVLSGLQALHSIGIIHRDFGAHNVVVVERIGCRPLVRIAGLGRCVWPGKLSAPRDLPFGVHYTAPEVLRGGEADERSDVFSCGVMLFEMLTGRRPFESVNPEQVRAAILRQALPRVSSLAPNLPREWIDVIENALAKDPARRFPSAHAFQKALPVRARATPRRGLPEDSSNTEITTTTDTHSTSSKSRRSSISTKCDPCIGRVLAGKYAVETLLGSGTAGAVYKCTHTALKKPVAVKVLHDWNRTSTEYVARFEAEALSASKLDHPNVTRIVDFGREKDGTLYLVMEFVEGDSLATKLDADGPVPIRHAVDIGAQIAEALVVAHKAGVIHRDLKPDNVMCVAGTDRVKVCDFGLAKLLQPSADQEELTGAGMVLGSPAYMSPEQVRGLVVDERADIYGLGVTIFEMLTGKLPYQAPTVEELFLKKVEVVAPRLSRFMEIDPLIDDVVARMLERDPEARHASAQELRVELLEALTNVGEDLEEKATVLSIWPERPGE